MASLWGLSTERVFTNVIKNTPEDIGPGKYDVGLTIGNKKKSKAPFGAKTNRIIFEQPKFEPPPVGEYDLPPGSSLSITSVFHSCSPRKYFNPSDTPSPAQYGSLKDWSYKQKKKYHPKPKPAKIPLTGFVGQQNVSGFAPNEEGEWQPLKVATQSENAIGPGYYNPKDLKKSVHTSPIGTYQDRDYFLQSRDNVPGPGAYSPHFVNKRMKTTISRVTRDADKPTTPFNVVPQSDWVKGKTESPAFKSTSKRGIFSDIPQDTPGPTAYAPRIKTSPDIERGNVDTCFGYRQSRNTFTINDNPGPGQYSSNVKWIKSHKSQLSRSKSPDFFTAPNTPGPGAYEENVRPSTTLNKKTSPSFASRTKRVLRKIEDGPGPADYTLQYPGDNEKIPPMIRGTEYGEAWIEPSKLDNPGPDAYQSIESNGPRPLTIPTSKRFSEKKDDTPGPGAYNLKHGSFYIPSKNSNVVNITDDY